MKNNPFGVLEFLSWDHEWNNHQYACDDTLRKAVRMMKDSGIGMVRMDFLWQDIEPLSGSFDFAKYDRIVDIVRAEGIEILGIFNYCALWASPTGEWNVPAADNTAFLKYVRIVSQRYKGKVNYWEVWNEPDSPVYWKNQDGLKSYCMLLQQSYRALKEIDPGCMVVNGGLTNELSSVNLLYDNGGKGYFDALNIHIFENPIVPGAVTRVRAYAQACVKVMQRNGAGDKKIWVTETGCPGVPNGIRAKNWWQGDNPGENEQAQWVEGVFDALLSQPQIERVFWAFFRDTKEHWNDGTDYFGLVRNDFSPKPAFAVYTHYAGMWAKERL